MLKFFVGGGTVLTYLAWFKSITDESLRADLERLKKESKQRLTKAYENKIDELQSENVQIKIESVENSSVKSNKKSTLYLINFCFYFFYLTIKTLQ